MPVLHLTDIPNEVYEGIRQRAATHNRTPEEEAVRLLKRGLQVEPPDRSQGEMLADLRCRSFTPPPGTPDSVTLLREDRER